MPQADVDDGMVDVSLSAVTEAESEASSNPLNRSNTLASSMFSTNMSQFYQNSKSSM